MVAVLLFTMLPARGGWRLLKLWSLMGQRLIWRTRLVTSINIICLLRFYTCFPVDSIIWYSRVCPLPFLLYDMYCTQVGCTPLHRAASTGNSELCELLIEEGADVDAVDKSGQTPLMNAVICQNKEVNLLAFLWKRYLSHKSQNLYLRKASALIVSLFVDYWTFYF